MIGGSYVGDWNNRSLFTASEPSVVPIERALIAANFNKTFQNWPKGDFNGDGLVNALDFNALATNFGASAGNAPPLGALAPEPSGLIASGLCGFATMARRRRGNFTP